MAVSVVTTTLKDTLDSEPDSVTARYSVTLTNGSGNDRCLIAISGRRRGAVRVLDSSTFDSASGTVFANISVDGGQSVGSGVVFFLDSELPSSAGTYDLDIVWSGNALGSRPAVIIELSGVNQTSPLANLGSNTSTTLNDGDTISATINGASGLFAISYVALVEPGTSTINNTIPSGTTNFGDVGVLDCAISAAFDTSVDSASEAYQWTVDLGLTDIDSVVTGVFSLAEAAALGGPPIGGLGLLGVGI